jgi:predicted GH43/DUF377 family glycosyl hydrolase
MNKYKFKPRGMTAGWKPGWNAPVLGGALGTVFDCHVIKEKDIFKMWFSWRPTRCIAYTESSDGIHWDNPQVVLIAQYDSAWEKHEVNRPTIVVRDGLYHMWYTGQVFASETTLARSRIGYAVSKDGLHWDRRSDPVLGFEEKWEGITVMCPHVLWEPELGCYRMWYSGGRMFEADAIGIAESTDGIHWNKNPCNPVFRPDPSHRWECSKVEACYVCPKRDGWYNMFYLGIGGDYCSCIGLARSRDGVTDWQRHPSNPVIAGYDGTWDWQGTCKSSVVETGKGYMLWYNAANRPNGETIEEIGLALHDGFDLGFPPEGTVGINERGQEDCGGILNYYIRDDFVRDGITMW